jgi:dihydrofolate reductase
MRKLFIFNFITLDGYFEGTNRDLSWHNVDSEFQQFAIEQLDTIDLLLFGRVTYEMMAAYWTTEDAKTNDPIVAGKMNSTAKIVFSKTLQKAEWENSTLLKEVAPSEILKIKNQKGKNIAIFGSSDLSLSFIKQGLIDEFRLMTNPIILGGGKLLFEGIGTKLNLKLTKTKNFQSGNVLNYYEPKK